MVAINRYITTALYVMIVMADGEIVIIVLYKINLVAVRGPF
tara:strand:+ start:116 stop:238 length:123 start_codon:yes stop_codon:yes gene_type:complete